MLECRHLSTFSTVDCGTFKRFYWPASPRPETPHISTHKPRRGSQAGETPTHPTDQPNINSAPVRAILGTHGQTLDLAPSTTEFLCSYLSKKRQAKWSVASQFFELTPKALSTPPNLPAPMPRTAVRRDSYSPETTLSGVTLPDDPLGRCMSHRLRGREE